MVWIPAMLGLVDPSVDLADGAMEAGHSEDLDVVSDSGRMDAIAIAYRSDDPVLRIVSDSGLNKHL